MKKKTDPDKYITTPEFNKLTKKTYAEILKQAKLASKNDNADFVQKKSNFDEKLIKVNKSVNSDKRRHPLNFSHKTNK